MESLSSHEIITFQENYSTTNANEGTYTRINIIHAHYELYIIAIELHFYFNWIYVMFLIFGVILTGAAGRDSSKNI